MVIVKHKNKFFRSLPQLNDNSALAAFFKNPDLVVARSFKPCDPPEDADSWEELDFDYLED